VPFPQLASGIELPQLLCCGVSQFEGILVFVYSVYVCGCICLYLCFTLFLLVIRKRVCFHPLLLGFVSLRFGFLQRGPFTYVGKFNYSYSVIRESGNIIPFLLRDRHWGGHIWHNFFWCFWFFQDLDSSL
jgi:hypothetical protein